MLPDNYFDLPGPGNDRKFIEEWLDKIPIQNREYACSVYSEVYLRDGRAEANKRLRSYVTKCINARDGKTTNLEFIKNYMDRDCNPKSFV